MGVSTGIWSVMHRLYTSANQRIDQPYSKVGEMLNSLAKRTKKHLPYDDSVGEFYGGEMERLTSLNYEKALRNLWKAEVIAPFLGIHDATPDELRRAEQGVEEEVNTTGELKQYLDSDEFDRTIEANYSAKQRKSLARLLSTVLHGEAYALYTSASLVAVVRGTGAKLGMAMQVIEEAKHFLVMRELVRRVDKVHPQTVWDRLALERVLAAPAIDRLFGMNIFVESVALTFFQMLGELPGMEPVLGFFHRDEARHSAYPQNYVKEAPLGFRLRYSPVRQTRRLNMIIPLLFLLFELEDDARTIGIDIYELGARCVDKIFHLSERSRFYTPFNRVDAMRIYNLLVNGYHHMKNGERYVGYTDYAAPFTANLDERQNKLKKETFDGGDRFRRLTNRVLEPLKVRMTRLGEEFISSNEQPGA